MKTVQRVSAHGVVEMLTGMTSNIRNLCTSVKRRRVVVTGLGLVTPLGCGVNHVWEKLLAGKSGVRLLEQEDYAKFPCRIAACVPKGTAAGQLDVDQHLKKAEARNLASATIFSIVAASEALTDSGWTPKTDEERQQTGVAIGMGMSSLEEIINTGILLREQGYSRVNPFFVTKILPNLAAGHVSIKFGLQGPNHCASTACATGVHAIGDAFRFIQWGDADVMVCGGTESCICPLTVAAFARMRALATNFNDNPTAASRPFDHRREGFVVGEGCGVVILESLDHALKRGARIHAEVLGYGLSGDGFHITAPTECGSGALRCMENSLRHGSKTCQDVGYINAHATSTPLGDAVENEAIKRLFGDHAYKLLVSSTKGAIGHLLGAAGAVEAIFTIMACKTGVVPPTLNLEKPDKRMDLNYVPNVKQPWSVPPNKTRIALNNSFGFGGTNASLCISSFVS